MTRVAAAAVAGATLGTILGFAAALFIVRPTTSEAPLVEGIRTELAALSQQVEVINATLESMRLQVPSSVMRQPDSSSTDSATPVADEIRELRKAFEAFRLHLLPIEQSAVSNQSLLHVGKNESRLREVWDGVEVRSDSANAAHFLWTPVDVYHEYGMPDWTGSIQGDTTWKYWICDHDEWAQYLVFRFTGGYFAWCAREQRRKTDK